MPNGHYGDITIDVSSAPYESGFKFNTIPFGGMTIDVGNSVRLSSAGVLIVDTNGAQPLENLDHLRGALWLERGATGTNDPDRLWICLKTNSGDTYDWFEIVNGIPPP